VSSYAPQSLPQAAFIVTMMYGVVSAALLYLKRWVVRRQARAVARSAAKRVGTGAAAIDAAGDLAKNVPSSIAGVNPRE
jgi:glutamate transport system permease protein